MTTGQIVGWVFLAGTLTVTVGLIVREAIEARSPARTGPLNLRAGETRTHELPRGDS